MFETPAHFNYSEYWDVYYVMSSGLLFHLTESSDFVDLVSIQYVSGVCTKHKPFFSLNEYKRVISWCIERRDQKLWGKSYPMMAAYKQAQRARLSSTRMCNIFWTPKLSSSPIAFKEVPYVHTSSCIDVKCGNLQNSDKCFAFGEWSAQVRSDVAKLQNSRCNHCM